MKNHVAMVREFMYKAGQATPTEPQVPDYKTRKLRARLILEEALETIKALGFSVAVNSERLTMEKASFMVFSEPNLVEIADGCADILVVTTGTAIACGIDLAPIQEMVDQNNLDKFKYPDCPECGENRWIFDMFNEDYFCNSCETRFPKEEIGCYRDESGKWIKPHNHKAPPIEEELTQQRNGKRLPGQ